MGIILSHSFCGNLLCNIEKESHLEVKIEVNEDLIGLDRSTYLLVSS